MVSFIKKFFNKNLSKSRRHKAFTLAEVLITLGIIGVVASLTIPTLYNNFQKQATITKLKNAYTTLYQAIRLSEIDNGDVSQWNFGADNNVNDISNWFNQYLAPYLKYTKTETYSPYINVYLADGTIIKIYRNIYTHAFIFINGINNGVYGKDVFVFFIGGTSSVSNNKELRPYDNGLSSVTSESDWINDSTYGCNKNFGGSIGAYCAGLIMYDNWQISKNYPYFN